MLEYYGKIIYHSENRQNFRTVKFKFGANSSVSNIGTALNVIYPNLAIIITTTDFLSSPASSSLNPGPHNIAREDKPPLSPLIPAKRVELSLVFELRHFGNLVVLKQQSNILPGKNAIASWIYLHKGIDIGLTIGKSKGDNAHVMGEMWIDMFWSRPH